MKTDISASSSNTEAKAPSAEDRIVCERIRTFRQTKGLSQTALAAAIGVSFQQLNKYERGENRVGASRLQNIAQALGMPIAAFYEEPRAGDTRDTLHTLLSTPGAADLLRAYTSISDNALRRNVLALVCTAVRISNR